MDFKILRNCLDFIIFFIFFRVLRNYYSFLNFLWKLIKYFEIKNIYINCNENFIIVVGVLKCNLLFMFFVWFFLELRFFVVLLCFWYFFVVESYFEYLIIRLFYLECKDRGIFYFIFKM